MGSPIGKGMYVWWNHHAQRKRVVYVIQWGTTDKKNNQSWIAFKMPGNLHAKKRSS